MIVIIDGGKEMNKIVNKKFSDDVSIEIQLLKEAIARRNITNHNITYYKQNDHDIVESKQKISISYMKALNEMEKLNWNLFNHIGFENHYTKEVLQFIRKGYDYWYAEVPINNGLKWDGYYWFAYSSPLPIVRMLHLFFAEKDWYGLVDWKFRRYKQHDRY